MRVLIIGHSFIRRLHSFMKDHRKDPKFNVTTIQAIEWLFRGGMTLEYIWNHSLASPTTLLAKTVRRFRPTHVYIEIGTNELTTATHNEACALQAHISDFVLWLGQQNIQLVVLGKILQRLADRRPHIPRTAKYDFGLLPTQFEDNRQLVARALLRSLPASGLLWQHLQLEGANRFICEDGVHLTITGMKRYYFSVRGAMLRMRKAAGDQDTA